MLHKNDYVRIDTPFLSHDKEMKIELPLDTLAKVIDMDADGDAFIDLPSLSAQLRDPSCWVHAKDFCKLSRMSTTVAAKGDNPDNTDRYTNSVRDDDGAAFST